MCQSNMPIGGDIKTTVMNFTFLPLEILTNILCYLPDVDVKNVRQSCKAWNNAAKVDGLWLQKCKLGLFHGDN